MNVTALAEIWMRLADSTVHSNNHYGIHMWYNRLQNVKYVHNFQNGMSHQSCIHYHALLNLITYIILLQAIYPVFTLIRCQSSNARCLTILLMSRCSGTIYHYLCILLHHDIWHTCIISYLQKLYEKAHTYDIIIYFITKINQLLYFTFLHTFFEKQEVNII